jgi:hypothetical protein
VLLTAIFAAAAAAAAAPAAAAAAAPLRLASRRDVERINVDYRSRKHGGCGTGSPAPNLQPRLCNDCLISQALAWASVMEAIPVCGVASKPLPFFFCDLLLVLFPFDL